MRGLWRVIALMGEDANSFNSGLASAAKQVSNSNLKDGVALTNAAPMFSLDLKLQPTPEILRDIDGYLRSVDPTLQLTAYELAEVNRIACVTQNNETPPHNSQKLFWQGLGDIGPRNRNSPGFMEAVGGLAGDNWTRSQFAAGNLKLNTLFDLKDLSQGDLQSLQNKMAAGQPSDLAAQAYVALAWHPKCASLITMPSDWIHFNA